MSPNPSARVSRRHPRAWPLVAVLLATASILTPTAAALAGQPVKWAELPEPVRKAILANGGKEGPADLESETKDGQALYEAQVKTKDGEVRDLVITADGHLLEVKDDDAADAAAERTAQAAKVLKDIKFSHPALINHPYLPLSQLKQDILEGTEDGEKIRVERTARPDLHKTFKIAGQDIEALVIEDREYKGGKLEEIAIDYFAQDDAGNVYYLGEQVDEYKEGKVIGHAGSWLLGIDTPVPGVLLPGNLKVGGTYRSEDVSNDINEKDEVVSLTESVAVPAGKYTDCLQIREKLADGTVEYKFFAKDVGVVRELPSTGDLKLVSHTTKP